MTHEAWKDLVTGGVGGGASEETLRASRFLENQVIPIDYLQLIMLVKLIKEKQWDTIKDLVKSRDASLARMIEALAQAGGANILTAWSHAHIIALLLEHNYYIKWGGAEVVVDGANKLATTAVISELIGSFTVPATLVFGGGAAGGGGGGALAGAVTKMLAGGV